MEEVVQSVRIKFHQDSARDRIREKNNIKRSTERKKEEKISQSRASSYTSGAGWYAHSARILPACQRILQSANILRKCNPTLQLLPSMARRY